MNIKNIVKMAFQSILSNKMRTFLTMLGIIIGVFSVIVLISLGQGATASVVDSISSMGSNVISVSMSDDKKSFDYKDIGDLEQLEGVSKVTPVFNAMPTVKYDLETKRMSVTGGNENYLGINNYEIQSGRSISPVDIDYRNKVAVIGLTTAQDLFGEDNPLNKEISVDGEKYTVVGTLKDKGSSIMGDSNEIVFVPVTTLMRQFDSSVINSLTVQAQSSEVSELAAQNVKEYMYKYFGSEDSYNVFSQDQLLDVMNESTAMLTAMLGGIAGISLLVGGIGIMNIMLVTVTERTREIGIRKAIGAGNTNIMIQFLIESSVLSGIGGLIGAVLGIAVSSVISKMIGINYVMNIPVIIGTFAFSLVVGVFFGLYPANKASKLKPVDALRFE
ncbi:MAG: ABC transporter permease [Sedimentibacter sp.]